MQKRSLAIPGLVALFALGIWWQLGRPAAVMPGPAAAGDSAAATPAPAGVQQADPADRAAKATAAKGAEADGDREVVDAVAVAGDAGLIGLVVDERGAPVAAATVACTATMGFDPQDVDPADFDFDDPARLERMRALAQQRVEVETAADGTFRLQPRGQSRTVDVRVRQRGFQVLARNTARPAGKDVDLGTLTLLRGAVVSGRVVDRSGQPVEAASVARRARGDNQGFGDFEFPGLEAADLRAMTGEVATDADGRFELPNVAPGEFTLRVRHPEHPLARREGLAVAAGQTLADVLVVVEPGASIRGRVVAVPAGTSNLRVAAAARRAEDASAQFIGSFTGVFGDAMADVGMSERSAAVAADGSFLLQGLAVGKGYRVWAVQGGRGMPGGAPCSARVDAPAGATGLELRFEAGVTVTVRVVDARGGAPIESLWVRDQLEGGTGSYADMFRAGRSARSRQYPDGVVTLANLRPTRKQTLHLTIEAVGFARHDRPGIVLPLLGQLDLGTVQLERAPVVHVEVTAAQDGKPVAGASVRLRDAKVATGEGRGMFTPGAAGPGAAKTDADGRCDVNALPGASVIVVVTDKEHAPYASEPIALPEREDAAHQVQLVCGGTVEVTVLAADGATPGKNVRVQHRVPAGGQDERGTDDTGRAVFDHLQPGEHGFRLGGAVDFDVMMQERVGGPSPQKQTDWRTVQVDDGGRADLRLQLRPTASLNGIVRQNGVALAGARVAFVPGTGEEGSGAARNQRMLESEFAFAIGRGGGSSTDATGRYRLTDLRAGEHRLRITHKDRSMSAVVRVSLRDGENTFDVDLETTIVRGTVRGADGRPLAGAQVRAAVASSGDTGGLGWLDGLQAPGQAGNDQSVRTDADGRYELRGVQAGVELVVRAQAKGFAQAVSAPVTVARGAARDGVDVSLPVAGAVRVHSAVEAPFATVSATRVDGAAGGRPVMQMLRNGSATLDGLQPGRWRITLIAGAQTFEPRTVEVAAGQTVDVDF